MILNSCQDNIENSLTKSKPFLTFDSVKEDIELVAGEQVSDNGQIFASFKNKNKAVIVSSAFLPAADFLQ